VTPPDKAVRQHNQGGSARLGQDEDQDVHLPTPPSLIDAGTEPAFRKAGHYAPRFQFIDHTSGDRTDRSGIAGGSDLVPFHNQEVA